MTKVVYKFPISVQIGIGTVLAKDSPELKDLLNMSGMSYTSEMMSATLTIDREDGKGLTEKENKEAAKILAAGWNEHFSKNEKFKDYKFTCGMGVRQDEPE